MKTPFFVARLPGGIGNQLFSLFASRYVAQETGVTNYLDFDGIDYSHHEDKHDISEFVLSQHETILIDSLNESLDLRAVVNLQKLKVQVHKRTKRFAKLLRFYSCELEQQKSDCVSLVLERLKTETYLYNFFTSISGYFPDFSFFDSLKDTNSKRLELKKPSKDFVKLEKLLTISSVLAVHIRLKDFLLHPNTIGNLSDDYFFNCIRMSSQEKKYQEIWVFSDDPTGACRRIENMRLKHIVRIIGLNETLSPCEALVLMSKCHGVICSNSTFSFWAAKFMFERDNSSHVYVPNFFRRDNATLIHGVPKNWKVAPVSWLQGVDSN